MRRSSKSGSDPVTQGRTLINVALVIILISSFVIRIVHLTDRSLWFDEAFTWRLIQFPFLEFIERAIADVHPILYYLLLRVWVAPLSALGINLTLFWLRFPSVLLSVATVYGIYYAGITLFQSRRIGIISALLLSVSAFQIQYAWEARMYALGTVLLCFAMAFAIKTMRAETRQTIWRNGIILGILTGALYHVHYFTLFSIAAIYLFIGGFLLFRLFKQPKETFTSAKTWSLVCGIVLSVLIFLPWLTTFLKQRAQVQQSYWIPPMNGWSIPNTMARILHGGVVDFSHQTAIIFSIVVVLVLVLPLIFGRKKGDWLLFSSFIIPFIGAWYLSRGTSIYQDRYFVFASIPLILLLARSLSLLPKKFYFSSVIAVAIFCYGFYTVTQFWTSLNFKDHPGTVVAVEYLVTNAKPNEPILVSSSFVYFPVLFHAQVFPLISSPRLYSESGALSHFDGGPILMKEDIIDAKVFNSNNQTIWVVDTTGFGGSQLAVPSQYKLESEKSFSELFGYQGDIVVRKYSR